MFPSFFLLLEAFANVAKGKFCVCNFLFLIFIPWYDVFLLQSRENIHVTMGVGKAMEMKQQQKARLNAHKTALHDDRFFCCCAIVHFNMRLMYDERENESFLCTRSNIFIPESLILYIIFLCAVQNLLSVPFSPALQISAQATTSIEIFVQCTILILLFHFVPLSFCDVQWKTWKCSVVFFLLFSIFKFSCQNSVFIMLLLLEPDCNGGGAKHVICISRVEWRFFSGW